MKGFSAAGPNAGWSDDADRFVELVSGLTAAQRHRLGRLLKDVAVLELTGDTARLGQLLAKPLPLADDGFESDLPLAV